MDWEATVVEEVGQAFSADHKRRKNSFEWSNYRYNYRAEHNEIVFSTGMKLGKLLGADMDILKAALLMHDIGRAQTDKGHAEAGARIAGDILAKTDFPSGKIDDVKYAIASHAGYGEKMLDTLEARIVWDADKLSKLGSTIILQKAMRLPLQGCNTWEAVSEFNAWLEIAEKISGNMKTGPGLEMAAERYETLKTFVAGLNSEFSMKER